MGFPLYFVSYALCQASELIGKIFYPCLFVFIFLFLCLYSSESLVSSSMIKFSRILKYQWYVMFSGVCWAWSAMITAPISLYTFFSHFYIFWGIYVPFPHSVVNNPFLQMVFSVEVEVIMVQAYVLFRLLGMLVLRLIADPPSEVAGYYLYFSHNFGVCFSFHKFGIWYDLDLEDFCKFYKCIQFFCA